MSVSFCWTFSHILRYIHSLIAVSQSHIAVERVHNCCTFSHILLYGQAIIAVLSDSYYCKLQLPVQSVTNSVNSFTNCFNSVTYCSTVVHISFYSHIVLYSRHKLLYILTHNAANSDTYCCTVSQILLCIVTFMYG